MITLRSGQTFRIPPTPAFVLVDGDLEEGDAPRVALSDLSDDQLDALGAAWTAQLHERARTQRVKGTP
jgi:hypothetical protein